LGHISIDIFIHRNDLNSLKIGGCISSTNLSMQGGGVAANVAYWLGTLGTDVSMIGVIADDPAGFFLKKDLERVNVKCYLKVSTNNPSASILIVVEEGGERSFIINGECLDELTMEDVPLADIQGGNLLYTSAYNIENSPVDQTIFSLVKASKNSNLEPFEVIFNLAAYTTVENHREKIKSKILSNIDILLGNSEEYESLLNVSNDRKNPFQLLTEIENQYPNLSIALLTDGENGCYYTSKNDTGHVPARKVSVVDTTGAGDGFIAGFIDAYVKDLPLVQSIKAGIELGSHICNGFGARYNPVEYLRSNKNS
jgi:fructokinase